VRLGFVRHGILSVKRRIYWETQLFARVRDWSDGITFFEFKINLNRWVGEHSPAFQLELTILNVYNCIQINQNNWENKYE
jgi:hypothetical protein